jgi:uncharacterized protein YbbC (DUF1343 family)
MRCATKNSKFKGKMKFINGVKLLILIAFVCLSATSFAQVKVGAEQMNKYLPLLKDKKVALVANQTSLVGKTHLLDTLLSSKINVVKVFAPEHGFRGNHSAGAHVKSAVDEKTGIPLVSIYGKNKKPSPQDLKDVDFLVFDIQDVGARFYTYISTLHYIMEAGAENKIPVLVLDRPNPNANYIDGPVLEPGFESFVGMHPVPIVHGMTIAEYACMINGEKWLANGVQAELHYVKVENYTRNTPYILPVPPSPNLRTPEAIALYPSLCLFEGTDVSVGRGTEKPFEIIGNPSFGIGSYAFKPVNIPGVADNPPHMGKDCFGFSLTNFAREYLMPEGEVYLHWLVGFYEQSSNKEKFFNSFFDKLAGTDKLRKQIIAKQSVDQIRKSWKPGLDNYSKIRAKYLMYPE